MMRQTLAEELLPLFELRFLGMDSLRVVDVDQCFTT